MDEGDAQLSRRDRTFRALAAERPRLQVVFMSGYHQDARIEPRPFVAKPFEPGTLLSKVADILASRDSPM